MMLASLMLVAQAAQPGGVGWANLAVIGGILTTIAGLVGALSARRLNSANAAKVLNDMATGIANDLRRDNATRDRKIARLEERAQILTESLAIAIPLLEQQGTVDPSTIREMKAALNRSRVLMMQSLADEEEAT